MISHQLVFRHYILLSVALLFAVPARSEESRFVSQWEASCQLPGHRLDIAFRSASGDPTNDDMSVTVTWDREKTSTLAIKPALFVSAGSVSDAKLPCNAVNAFQFRSGNILLLLARDDRPSENRLKAVLLNGRTGQAIDIVEDLGEFRGVLTVVRDGDNFRVLMSDVAAVDWLVLGERKNRIVHTWERIRE